MTLRRAVQSFLWVGIVALFSGCSGGTTTTEVKCDPGYLDINGECKLLCQSHEDCDASQMCSESGYCIADDGSRCTEDNCGVCDDDPTNDCVQDCAGTWGGTATTDECGTCDDDPSNDCVADCAGTMGGTATEDECGVCDDDASNDCEQDCAGTWGGGAVTDDCGVCDEDASNDNSTCEQDCAGTWAGTATTDECGACDDDASNDCVQDCAGVWGGAAATDECGSCDTDSTNDCVQDCAGAWGGTATVDACGTCDDDASNDCQADCAGVPGGNSYVDDCGVCDSDVSNDNGTCSQDCAGEWGGSASTDDCGVCDADESNDNGSCVQDCEGTWAGTATTDDCGVCDDDSGNDNSSCAQDCEGIWGGAATLDDCGVCDTDSSNDNVTCEDCNGVANGPAALDDCGTCDADATNDCCSGVWTTWTDSDCGDGGGASPTSCVDGVLVEGSDLCPGDEAVTVGALGRTLSITSVDLNGSGGDTAAVAPGASVSLSLSGNVVDSDSNCGGCITQFYARLDGVFSLCLGSSTGDWNFNESTTFTAPTEPGVYYINPASSWQMNCVDGTGVSDAPSDSTIAVLVVEGTLYCSDGWAGTNCDTCADSYFAVGSDCAACPGSVPTLVSNGSGEAGDLSGWTITASGGDGWTRSGGGYDATDGYFRTSYNVASRYQVVDLVAAGYTEAELDSAPPVTVGEYYKSFYTSGDPYTLNIELRDGGGSVIQSYATGSIESTSAWTWAGDTFTDYGPGLRYIYIADSGDDVEYWGGHYGTIMDGAQIRIALEASNACNGYGVCSAGDHGNGECVCDTGFSGPACGIVD